MQKIILAGNPNTGKTTLFNTLSHSREHASNWHGVTISVKEKPIKFEKEEYMLCDIPGLYSLGGYSFEEKLAIEYLEKNKDAVVVCLLDANNLRRNLFLALELKERVPNLLLAINMAKEIKGLNKEKLEELLGLKIFLIDARKRKSLSGLLEEIKNMSIQKPAAKKETPKEEFLIAKFEKRCADSFKTIDSVLDKSGYKTKGFYGESRADKILLNPVLSFVIFACVMGFIFFLTFGSVGSFLSGFVSDVFEKIFTLVMNWLQTFVKSEVVLKFIKEGVFGGALTILTFMPQIMLLFFCLNFLEDIGYLSRVALMFDGVFKKIGLTGRSAFSLIMGFGCTTTAVLTTRNLDNDKLRKRTAILLPFMTCSAKLPIFAVICSAFFTKHKALMVFIFYMLSILLMILVALIMKGMGKQTEETFMLELPKYRFPNMKKICLNAMGSAIDFFIRVGGVLLLSSMVVFLLYNFSFNLSFVPLSGEKSILEVVANLLKHIFTPLGFGTTGAVIAIISGLIAKEMVVSSLAIVNGVMAGGLAESLLLTSSPVHFSPLSAISFLVFILLYPPCMSAFFAMKREVGLKCALKSFFLQLSIAYVMSALVYWMGRLGLGNLWWLDIIIFLALAIFVFLVVKYSKRRKTIYSLETIKCQRCKEKCHGDNII